MHLAGNSHQITADWPCMDLVCNKGLGLKPGQSIDADDPLTHWLRPTDLENDPDVTLII